MCMLQQHATIDEYQSRMTGKQGTDLLVEPSKGLSGGGNEEITTSSLPAPRPKTSPGASFDLESPKLGRVLDDASKHFGIFPLSRFM